MSRAQTIDGTVSRIVNISPTGGAIFRLLTDDTACTIRVIANYRAMPLPPRLGESWSLTGHFENNPVYGRQFYAETAALQIPTGLAITDLLSQHPNFVGIGRQLARRLWRKLGVELSVMLQNGDIQALCKAGLPPLVSLRIVDSWHSYVVEVEVSSLFVEKGFPLDTIHLAISLWGAKTSQIVTQNPYCLHQISTWEKIDHPALHTMQIRVDDQVRLIAACESVCDEAWHKYSSALPKERFTHLLALKLGGNDLVERSLSLAIQANKIIVLMRGETEFIQGRGQNIIESCVRQRIQKLLQLRAPFPPTLRFPETQTAAVAPIAPRDGSAGQSTPPDLNQSMVSVIDLPTSQCSIYADMLTSISQIATHVFPSETVKQLNGFTNATKSKLLSEVLASTGNTFDEECHTVILHNAESLDILAANQFLQAIPQSCRLILVGDHAQPFPSGPGLFFHLLAGNSSIKVFRPANESDTGELSAELAEAICRVSNQERSASIGLKQHKYTVCVCEGLSEIYVKALGEYRKAIEQGSAIIIGKAWLTARILNAHLHDELMELRKLMKQHQRTVQLRWRETATVGDVITFHRNDYRRGLFIGSRGTVTEVFEGPLSKPGANATIETHVAMAEIDTAGTIRLTKDDCKQFSLGYAIPLQYATWSKWQCVVLCAEQGRVVDREWVLAAVSRGTLKATVIGSSEDLDLALKRAGKNHTRTVGLAL